MSYDPNSGDNNAGTNWINNIFGVQQTGGAIGTDTLTDPTSFGPSGASSGIPQTQNLNPAQYALPQGFQTALMNTLQAQSNGQGPSLAAQQASQVGQQTDQQVMGMLASQRGLNPGMAARMAGNQLASANAGTTAAAANARLAEMMQARGLLGQVSGQAAGQGIDIAGANAQAQNAALQAALQRQYGMQAQQNQAVTQGALQQQQGSQISPQTIFKTAANVGSTVAGGGTVAGAGV